jgi:hypothetical protein
MLEIVYNFLSANTIQSSTILNIANDFAIISYIN